MREPTRISNEVFGKIRSSVEFLGSMVRERQNFHAPDKLRCDFVQVFLAALKGSSQQFEQPIVQLWM
jgi:hypothetical protein